MLLVKTKNPLFAKGVLMFENRNESKNGSAYLAETLFADIHPSSEVWIAAFFQVAASD